MNGSELTKGADEQFCNSCGAVIKLAAEICPKCGVRQKSSIGIFRFVSRAMTSITNKVAAAKKAIQEELATETYISTAHKAIAILVASSAGWTGVTGLGSIIAGRKKAGFAMLGIPLVLGILTIGCLFATFVSGIASIVVIGIPFFLFFGSLSLVLLPLTVSTYFGFWIADVAICVKAKRRQAVLRVVAKEIQREQLTTSLDSLADLVPNEGIAESIPESKVSGVFGSEVSADVTTHRTTGQENVDRPLMPTTSPNSSVNAFLERAKAGAADFSSKAKAAAQLMAMQAERTKIMQIKLPVLYQAVGKHLHEQTRIREEFAENATIIDGYLRQLESLKATATNRRPAQGAGEKAKAMAVTTKEMAEAKTIQLRLKQAFGELGKLAFEKHGEKCGPEALVRPILDSQSRLNALDSEIQKQAASYQGRVITPKRLAIAGVVAVIMVPIAILVGPPPNTANSPTRSPSDSASPNSTSNAANQENGSPVIPASPFSVPSVPTDQSAFVEVINSSRARYNTAANDLKKSAIRAERRAHLAKAVPGNRISNWLGTLLKVSTQSDGKAYVAVQIAGSEYVTVQTWNNALSDIGSHTLIENSSPLYNVLADLSPGDPVTFSGDFLDDDDDKDHFDEISLTENGSMTEPAFILRFSRIAKGH